jgi:hypothetical protein
MFGSTTSERAPAAAAAPAAASDDATDVLLHAGGPVWALDWCPAEVRVDEGAGAGAAAGPSSSSRPPAAAAAAAEPKCTQYLAVGCHPQDSPLHIIGRPLRGPNAVQIWEVHGLAGCSSADSVPLPRMALALAHDGGVTWHCRWCPDPALADAPGAAVPSGTLPRLGLLAAALGDGSVQVWAVPHPGAVPPPAGAGAPAVVRPLPVASLVAAQLGGSLPAVVDWLPSAPFDKLLVGCWDGSVAVLRLNPSAGGPAAATAQAQWLAAAGAAAGAGGAAPELAALTPPPPPPPLGMDLLAHFPADTLPLRAARWAPPGAPYLTLEDPHRLTFLTAGHEGAVKVWDARDQFQPAYAQQLSTTTVLDAAWTASPLGIVAAMEDGSARGALLGSRAIEEQIGAAGKPLFGIAWRGANAGALWAVEVHPAGQVMAYAGEDGVVGLAPAEFKWDHRKRRAHLALGSMPVDELGRVCVYKQAHLELDNGGLYVDRVVERAAALAAAAGALPDRAQAVQRLAWAPGVSAAGAAWLAAGTGAGLVRCTWVSMRGL